MMPKPRSVFISHGSPTILWDRPGRAFRFWRDEFSKVARQYKAFVIVSAHFASRGGNSSNVVQVSSANGVFPMMYDYHGFPKFMYEFVYPRAHGDSALASKVSAALQKNGIRTQSVSNRGLDHGAFVPLELVLPADAETTPIKVVEVEMPSMNDWAPNFEIGRALRDLLDEEDALLIASGSAVHNFAELEFGGPEDRPDAWAKQYIADVSALLVAARNDDDFRTASDKVAHHPQMRKAHGGSPDHLMPLFVAAGAARSGATVVHDSFTFGNLAMTSYGFV